ncbi:MAG TPA: TPM domain-containing protein [Anaeromyxobacter sp.]|nr:TPM domain-containing protein [Anaeromyxobacter sp.]
MASPLRTALALAAGLALQGALPARGLVPVPPLTGPVVDLAGMLDRGEVARLSALARAARAQHGGQGVELQFLTLPSLEGEPIEDLSIRVAEAWKIGSKGADNGVLVTVSRDDRAVRIEVGGGLEGALTDAQSFRIIRDTIGPAFRAGRFGDGLYDAGVQILGALGALPPEVAGSPRSRPAVHFSSLAIVLFVILFLVIRIVSGFGYGRRRSLFGVPWIFMGGGGSRLGGGGRFGGGGGWGGGGGGGWSGGGGGFSGGGASGKW